MKKTFFAIIASAALVAAPAWASDIQIAADTSGLPAEMVQNFAASAKSMGVKEPMKVAMSNEGGRYAVISGSSATTCRIKLSGANPPAMLGISCR